MQLDKPGGQPGGQRPIRRIDAVNDAAICGYRYGIATQLVCRAPLAHSPGIAGLLRRGHPQHPGKPFTAGGGQGRLRALEHVVVRDLTAAMPSVALVTRVALVASMRAGTLACPCAGTGFCHRSCHGRFLPIELLAHLANIASGNHRPGQAGDGEE